MTLPLVEQFQYGLDAPICLTWELTYACNLSCVHCLSSSGRRDPRELSTTECRAAGLAARRLPPPPCWLMPSRSTPSASWTSLAYGTR